MSVTVSIRRGAIYLPVELVQRWFADIEAVIVLVREGAVWVLPVRQMASGGCLLKVRNAAGDRVALVPDVFAAHDLEGWEAEALAAHWSEEEGALCIPLPEEMQTNLSIRKTT